MLLGQDIFQTLSPVVLTGIMQVQSVTMALLKMFIIATDPV